MEAEIALEYDDLRIAKTVAEAVSPDNFKTPKSLTVATMWKRKTVFTTIKCEGKVETFIATIDDLLFCISTVEKTLQTTRKF